SVTVNGRENIPTDRAVVFTPNHQSDYDIPLMLTQLGRVYPLVAKVETLKIPLVRTWMRLFGCVFLDRDNPRQAVAAIKEVGALLTDGTSVVVFPEGTRSKCDTMGEFKSGAFKMAFVAKAPIVPIVIDGSYRAMEANHNLMCPAHITMTILPAVETAQLDRAAQKALPAQIAASIAALLPAQNAGIKQ
ncbi:MAG: lysophospholipid acyltransferase family protein, partial [Ruthenibacterium sp.]